ncbi:flavin-containing monooxygenase 5-like [Boleophthalmus pectinirostris]|uniref:flavin-containing monooxygenase 5-like n=1 Tax=Boleophthalmus pectinirostris TaxID=150288 RepID=UPI0024306D58|nr:flavin-containing monooxygenase 5-like [Boleophthalmus pectinirostris]XP_055020727.1 flavin-containing monooxygenase 5-like [Boleophthalmus pectinirostris]
MVQRVAVIGAGLSGLSCIKTCLEEGLQPTCFESSQDIGGVWRYKEQPEPGKANIYQSVVVNSSKEMMAYSDFPPPAELPNNMHHSEVLGYLRLYADHFKLLPHIQFKTTVQKVRQTADFALTGQWEVYTEKQNGQKDTHVFDAVMVCTGHFTHPRLPLKDFPGIENFEGRYFHSWEYRNAQGMEGKRVVVIGIGNSGADIAVDISRVAEKVYLSTRSGAWVVSRVGPGGFPLDITFSRMDQFWGTYFPSWSNKNVEKALNEHFDHTLYGLQPAHNFFARIPVANDELPARIISGRVRIKPNVKEFSGSSVFFDDGTVMDKVDVVIFATGYDYNFPFLPQELQKKTGYRLRLYKQMIPPSLAHPTLAVVGLINALGAVNCLSEMQGRWATRVFKGIIKLPSEETMNREIEKETEIMHKWFSCSEHNPLQLFYIPYLDSLAKQVGVFPNLLWLFLTDPRLAVQVLFGPCTSYQYRLTGPGRWSGARQAILTQWDRVYQPFKTRVVPKPERKPKSKLKFTVILSGTALMFYLLYK